MHPIRTYARTDSPSYGFDEFRPREPSASMKYVHMLAQCLHLSGRRIFKLDVVNYQPEFLQEHLSAFEAFAHLRHLRLETCDDDYFLYHPTSSSILSALLRPCRAALEHLEIVCNYPSLRNSDGIGTLRKLIADETGNLCLPNLRHLCLSSLVIETKALIEALAAQPRLSSVDFSEIELVTPCLGQGWRTVAMALPQTIEHWYASGTLYDFRQRRPGSPTTYSESMEWKHSTRDLGEAGWRVVSASNSCSHFTRVDLDG
jgi:hypothetical protein